jgi:hypothetical protein
MLDNLKALAVILTIATVVFAVAKPVCLRFMAEDDFLRRRNIWFALTIAGLVSPNFWLFAAIALPLIAWGAHKDPNPLALYVFVYCVVPSLSFEIPVMGINALFQMNFHRVLAFAILVPAAWRLIHSKDNKTALRFTAMDLCVLAYAGLTLALLMPYESGTNSVRRGFLHFMDFMVLYFVATRAFSSRKAIVEIMATFCLLCAILAPMAFFEAQRHWLLYVNLGIAWGDIIGGAYVIRDGFLRAQVTAGQSIPLGYLLAIGFGLWMYLSSILQSRQWAVAVGILMWVGMIAAHARAPWLAAVAIYFVYVALGPNGATRFAKASIVFAIAAGLILVSPIGERVIDNLPFVGKVDASNVEYRQELAKQSWEMVKENPLFGNPSVMKNLESLRQGEGIIDLVNTYAQIAMFYGVPALFFYIGPYVIGIWKVFRMSRRLVRLDPDLSSLGAVLVACMLGFLLAMAMGGFGTSPYNFSVIVIGLAVGYSRLDLRKEMVPGQRSQEPGLQSRWAPKRS